MSSSRSRRRRRMMRRIRKFFHGLTLLCIAAVLVVGTVLVLMWTGGDDSVPAARQSWPEAVTAAPVVTEAPSPAPTAEPTEAPSPSPTPTAEPTPSPTPEPTPRSVTFRVTGDLMASESMLAYAKSAGGAEYDYAPMFALVADALANADYTMSNLETTIGMYKNQPYSGYPQFNTPESYLDALKGCGIDFLTLANNHMLDRYFDGMKNTVANVEAYGFDHSGAYVSQEARGTAAVAEICGVRVGFVSYTEGTNGMETLCDAAAKAYGVPYLYTADFEGDVQRLRDAGAEIVIAFPHWGEEYTREPNAIETQYARKLADAGVDVIIGSHPHVLQKVDALQANGRQVLVAYSMGNFISTQNGYGDPYTDTGMILEFTMTEQPDGSFAVTGMGYLPTYCWIHDGTLQVVPISQYMDECPEGMSGSTYSRMKECYAFVRKLMNESIAVLEG